MQFIGWLPSGWQEEGQQSGCTSSFFRSVINTTSAAGHSRFCSLQQIEQQISPAGPIFGYLELRVNFFLQILQVNLDESICIADDNLLNSRLCMRENFRYAMNKTYWFM